MDEFIQGMRDTINHLSLMKKASTNVDAVYLDTAIQVMTTTVNAYIDSQPAVDLEAPSVIVTPQQLGNLKGITSIRDHARRRRTKVK